MRLIIIHCVIDDLPMPSSDFVHQLYSEHHGWLRGWLRGQLNNAADAADLAHDTFVRLLQRREAPQLSTPRAFLRTVARGLVIDHWRREELRRAYLEALAQLPEAYTPDAQTREMLLELLERIDRLLDGLKPKVRQAFVLVQCEGLSQKEAAARLGISLRSVERYVADALYHCYVLRYEQAAHVGG